MNLRKRIIVPVIVLAALAAGGLRQQKMEERQRSIEETRRQMVALSNRVHTASLELRTLEEELRQQKAARQELGASLSKAERELSRISPESRWATLPADLPNWNSESPYVWVRKEIMKEIRTRPFAEDGSLLPVVGPVLAVNPEQMEQLNDLLPDILDQYKQIEATNVVVTDEHLLAVGPIGDGKAITVSWEPSGEGARLKSEYEATLRSALGEQRTELLLAVDPGTLSSQFGRLKNGSETKKKITLLRRAHGGFNLAVDKGTSSMSTSVSKGQEQILDHYIPQHIRHLFAELLEARE